VVAPGHLSKGAARQHRIEQYQSMPGGELVKQLTWTLTTIKRLQREYAEMRVARRRQRRKSGA
jgi:hypothetical protein